MHDLALTPREEALAQRTAAIVLANLRTAQIDSALTETIGPEELQRMLGCKSKSATYRAANRLRIHPYAPGKYRLKDVQNRIAQRSHAVNHAAKSAA